MENAVATVKGDGARVDEQRTNHFGDSLRYLQRSVAAGVDATVDVWRGMPHGFVGNVGQLEASSQALKMIGVNPRLLNRQHGAIIAVTP
jgi:acetyl esterase/lipase